MVGAGEKVEGGRSGAGRVGRGGWVGKGGGVVGGEDGEGGRQQLEMAEGRYVGMWKNSTMKETERNHWIS